MIACRLSVTAGEIEDHRPSHEEAGGAGNALVELSQPVGDRRLGRECEGQIGPAAETRCTWGARGIGHFLALRELDYPDTD